MQRVISLASLMMMKRSTPGGTKLSLNSFVIPRSTISEGLTGLDGRFLHRRGLTIRTPGQRSVGWTSEILPGHSVTRVMMGCLWGGTRFSGGGASSGSVFTAPVWEGRQNV